MARYAYSPREAVAFDDALVIVGFPSPGYVAQVAARHIIQAQSLPLVGAFECVDGAPTVSIVQGVPLPTMRLHLGAQACGLDHHCSSLAVLLGDAMPPDGEELEFARAFVNWAEGAHVKSIVVLEGMPLGIESAAPRISGASPSLACRERLKELHIPFLDDVVVTGTTAALLAEGENRTVDVLGLFVEAHNEFADAAAAAALVEAADKFLLHIPIDSAPLLAHAEAITKQLRTQAARRRNAAGDVPMYG